MKISKTVSLYLIKIALAIIVASLMVLKLNLTHHGLWLLFLATGLVLGLLFPLIDSRFLHKLYFKQLQSQGTLSCSLIFLAVFVPLGVFIVTSSSSPLGIGFVLGFMLGSSVDLVNNLSLPQQFQATYLYQFARDFTQSEQKFITVGFVVASLLVSLLAIFRV